MLEKNNVKATFFVTGDWVKQYPNDVKKIAKAGHELGNHSEDHKSMLNMTEKQCSDEIMKVHERVKKLTGVDMNLFRTPYGDFNNTILSTARNNGYYTIQWDIDTYDWKDYTADCIVNRAVNNEYLGNGSILLMHEGGKNTVKALGGIIEGLQEKGYEFVPVSKLIHKKNYVIDSSGRQVVR